MFRLHVDEMNAEAIDLGTELVGTDLTPPRSAAIVIVRQ